MFSRHDNRLVYSYDAEKLWIEPWGPDSLRIRATQLSAMPPEDWALLPPPEPATSPEITISPDSATLTNGKIRATVSARGKLTVSDARTGTVLLEEYSRNRLDVRDPKCSALNVAAREFKAVPRGGDAHHITARFESLDRQERLFGMGQYQQPLFNLKGADLELAHRNSQASVPFLLSSRGYGLLWNNPAVGRAVLGTNLMTFEAYSARALDYWVVAGDRPADIVRAYAAATGRVPMMPEFGLGFWQCKLRYQTQEELLGVAREYRRRGLPLDVIVVDFFHWPLQGEWKFDPAYWPDPDAMVRELKELGVELMVSVWPTVDKRSENWDEMVERGLLVRVDRGMRTTMDFQGDTVHFDATNPAAREFVWAKVRQNYYAKGIRLFWLDEAEPEYSAYDFDNYRYHSGSVLSTGNIYPAEYARAFYEGLAREGHADDAVSLVRCAWAGSQRYGALVWSGDVASSWSSFRSQLAAGLHMAVAGLPWWTTDIGGFHGGDPREPAFRELFVRWFQWGAFCPVFRLHGDREPRQPQHGTTGGAACLSGGPNEVWSYGPEVYEICKKYMALREHMRPYVRRLMRQAHEDGTPVMRPLFLEFPDDPRCWNTGEEYMFGDKYLVCPVMQPGVAKLAVYLPAGAKWSALEGGGGGEEIEGGQVIEADCPIDYMPVFVRVAA
ncbi:glycoside hydrolase family 31 protein [Thermothelomyces thermophilus ATCC 42464]|uniref:Glycoside hydrolase family 31 protein n=1 Tax=Thermothelomyces thermophilus (strain ATCC 42464 / BCRC 31852 / DSM 1799) TaxID=573729 RepID=G2QH13_THET4|nr:glycoside hydrolase family 31 protein [Thermothelomyces thermophilus ATCC 42464]AEO58673.1 glycoside hydrolase family 31 protein [Thermothelomyces thermophilus ATCC 42464]